MALLPRAWSLLAKKSGQWSTSCRTVSSTRRMTCATTCTEVLQRPMVTPFRSWGSRTTTCRLVSAYSVTERASSSTRTTGCKASPLSSRMATSTTAVLSMPLVTGRPLPLGHSTHSPLGWTTPFHLPFASLRTLTCPTFSFLCRTVLLSTFTRLRRIDSVIRSSRPSPRLTSLQLARLKSPCIRSTSMNEMASCSPPATTTLVASSTLPRAAWTPDLAVAACVAVATLTAPTAVCCRVGSSSFPT
mmetsp:Transcript_10375/g.32826  ORF Transcript_10375/g.32826 Transcript_10375/m.32826 type:complete len:245 (-) Transcript_10375:1435-2169(-)